MYNVSVPANGSSVVPLNYGSTYNSSNFEILEGVLGSSDSSYYISSLFDIQKYDDEIPQQWSLNAVSPLPNSASTSTPSSTARPSGKLPTAALVPIIIVVCLCFITIAVLSIILARKSRRLSQIQASQELNQRSKSPDLLRETGATAEHPNTCPHELANRDGRPGELPTSLPPELDTELVRNPLVTRFT